MLINPYHYSSPLSNAETAASEFFKLEPMTRESWIVLDRVLLLEKTVGQPVRGEPSFRNQGTDVNTQPRHLTARAWAFSDSHHVVQLRRRQAMFQKTELALLFDLTGSINETRHGLAIERGSKADASNASRCKLGDGK